MRFANVLIATAALFNCYAVSAASGADGQAKLPMARETDSAFPIRVLDTANGKRVLRSYYEDEEDNEDDNEEEERLSAKWTEKAAEWAKLYKPIQIKQKLSGLGNTMNAKNTEKYNLFLAAYLKRHPGGF